MKAAKATHIQNELNNNANDPKKFWRNIKEVLPDQSGGSINIQNQLTQEIMPKNLQAQEINNFFANVGEKLASKFRSNTQEPPVVDVAPDDVPTLTVRNITQVEVLKLIDTISMYKSSGMDNVNSRVLKDFLQLGSREVTHLYNRILDTGVFPDKWKVATITPIPKVPNATSPTDLRPISLLPIPGKLLEKFITVKIQSYLEDKNFFVGAQNGFRKGKSTSAALTSFLDDVIGDLNESRTNVVTYLDFQKAIDTINHRILLRKLRHAGLGESLLDLLGNYLTNRTQKNKLYNSVSDLQPANIGVPQGSTIGPIMFIVYINDLPSVLENSSCIMYADDTVMYCAHSDNRIVRRMLQADLNNVQEWCAKNKLSMNIKKTKLMVFMSDHKRKRSNKFKFYMRGREIDEVDSYRYLGTEIDNGLTGNAQYNKLAQTLGFKLSMFGKVRRFLTTRAALTVYKSTILPLLDYNDQFQVLWNKEKLSKLQKMQNWGLRTVYSKTTPPMSEEQMHEAGGVLGLEQRRILHLLGTMYHRSNVESFLDNRGFCTRQFDKIKFKVLTPNIKQAFRSPNYYYFFFLYRLLS